MFNKCTKIPVDPAKKNESCALCNLIFSVIIRPGQLSSVDYRTILLVLWRRGEGMVFCSPKTLSLQGWQCCSVHRHSTVSERHHPRTRILADHQVKIKMPKKKKKKKGTQPTHLRKHLRMVSCKRIHFSSWVSGCLEGCLAMATADLNLLVCIRLYLGLIHTNSDAAAVQCDPTELSAVIIVHFPLFHFKWALRCHTDISKFNHRSVQLISAHRACTSPQEARHFVIG